MSHNTRTHTFSVIAAEVVGVKAAILLENIFFWVQKNTANEQHIHEGRAWTYNSIKAFGELFPYMSEKQIRTALKKLIEEGYIKTGNFNPTPYDRTLWYTLTDKGIALEMGNVEDDKMSSSKKPEENFDLPERENENDCKGEPIPDINTDINTDINNSSSFSSSSSSSEMSAEQKSLQTVVREWDKARGGITSCAEAERIADLFDTYGKQAMLYAIRQAVDHDAIRIAYVEAVLRRAPYTHDLTEEEKRRNREAILNDE